ncbi:hypothetical protein K435DRAFT_693507 [Dendrothele bispora CBS 962.96]|uniref:DUF6589 domain-containing protein n=1 Tax=Dendrothele bispora (strain CBS 962.96) TaxID=1314807 RepID=A0A4V4HC11_DENBC|nr:hypothetical protein K435DRAFT_693507 [Dendrothele bispora CBS 962.96]
MSEWVILMHGDLLTKERLESVKASRSIEDTAKAWFQQIIFIPGLFHYKMACADAFWRIWVKPKASHNDGNSLVEHVGVLRPDETGKFMSSPGFRMVHDTIHYDLVASMINCWSVEAKKKGYGSLEDFAASTPKWEDLVTMSENIVQLYVASSESLSEYRDCLPERRDQCFENQILRNRDELLYVDMSYAMNAGDIGCVEASMGPWIHLFKATGKHKYATHMLHFLKDLKDRFPSELSQIIRMNWLVNPTSKEMSFRGVDWLVELNNLYTKVIHAGGSSNRTIEHIIKESPLIELYCECHMAIENGFYLLHRTIQHAPPDMRKTLHHLGQKISSTRPHEYTPGRKVKYEVPDHISVALNLLATRSQASLLADEDNDLPELAADDLVSDFL